MFCFCSLFSSAVFNSASRDSFSCVFPLVPISISPHFGTSSPTPSPPYPSTPTLPPRPPPSPPTKYLCKITERATDEQWRTRSTPTTRPVLLVNRTEQPRRDDQESGGSPLFWPRCAMPHCRHPGRPLMTAWSRRHRKHAASPAGHLGSYKSVPAGRMRAGGGRGGAY